MTTASNSFVRRATPLLPALLCAALVVSSAGCGRKSPPIPPPSKAPATASDLTALQRGEEVVLEFGFPAATAGGLVLDGLAKVDIYSAESSIAVPLDDLDFFDDNPTDGESKPGESANPESANQGPSIEATAEETVKVNDGSGTPVVMMEDDRAEKASAAEEEPGQKTSKGSEKVEIGDDEESETEAKPKVRLPRMKRQEFASSARLIKTLEGATLDAAVVGGRIQVTLPLEELDRPRNLFYGVVFHSLSGLESAYSNLSVVQPATPPTPPMDVEVEASGSGIRVQWKTPETELEGFHVYRRNATARRYGAPLKLLPTTQTSFLDRTAAAGGSYIYAVTSVLTLKPLTESPMSGEFEVDFRDRFAPAVPKNLVVLTEPNEARLLWEASDATDLAGYFIERIDPDGDVAQLNAEPITAIEYIDRNVAAGATYRYRVWAIDKVGNKSQTTDWVDAPIP